jgi:hypothetical protein
VVDDILATIEEKYGKMMVTHGDKHTYVGMDIKFTNNGDMEIIMAEYLK